MIEKFTLKQWRTLKGYSRRALADKVGVTERTIYTYENDVEKLGNASYVTVKKIADELDIKTSDIFLNIDSEKPKFASSK